MLVLGDVHGERDGYAALLDRLLRRTDEAPVLQSGDLHHYEPPRDVWFVAGNNEDHDVIDLLRSTDAEDRDRYTHVHLLDGVVGLDGLRVAGLSGNHAPSRYGSQRSELAGERRRHFVSAEVERCKTYRDVDVFVAHEAPHGILEKGGYDVGCRPIDEILTAVEPRLCLVGHHHRHATGTFGETRVVALAPAWERIYRLDPDTLELDHRDVIDGGDDRTLPEW